MNFNSEKFRFAARECGGRKRRRRKRKKKNRLWCRIYALREDVNSPVRYVGQTRLKLKDRLDWHMRGWVKKMKQGRRLSPAEKWVASLWHPPIIELIDGDGIWDISEAVWIDRMRQRGEPLLNVLSVVK